MLSIYVEWIHQVWAVFTTGPVPPQSCSHQYRHNHSYHVNENVLIVMKSDEFNTVESRYNVLPGGSEKIRCNDSTLYSD